jgi:prepilin-type N-terminal cleavage/methylation domain-containing protein
MGKVQLKSRGFTLIELLVVISIIALLLSILLPSLAKVKESSKRLVCQSNIRQMIIPQFSYASSNDGKFPPHWTQYPSWVKEALSFPKKLEHCNVVDALKDYIPGEMTICPIYARRADDLVLAYSDAYWNWPPDRFTPSAHGAWDTRAPNKYLSYMWLTNWTGWSEVRLNSELDFAGGETPWPTKETECRPTAAMVAHRVEVEIEDWDLGTLVSVPERGHGSMPGRLRFENPVGYGDGHVDIHLRSDIRPRARIKHFMRNAIIY